MMFLDSQRQTKSGVARLVEKVKTVKMLLIESQLAPAERQAPEDDSKRALGDLKDPLDVS
jgi:hypothetical protein